MAYCIETFKSWQKKVSIPRVFVIFFHPDVSVTALGGAEKRFVEIMKFFCKSRSLKISVLEPPPSLLAAHGIECQKYLLPFGFFGKGWLRSYFGWILWVTRAIFKSFTLVRREKPSFIFVPNNTLPNLFLGYIVCSVLRLPLVVVVHHIDVPFSSEKPYCSLYNCYRSIKYGRLVSLVKTFTFYITLSLLKRTKGIIAVSNFTAKALRVHGILNVKIFVSGNAVDVNFISNVAPFNVKKNYDGVFVGRIAKEKGVFDLLNVWKKVVENKCEAKLLIVGCGLEVFNVKKEIVRLRLENNVFLRGHCSDEELYGLLKSSKVFIFPSLFEGWGIAVAEALACGLSVVAYDIPALKENFGNCRSVFLVSVRNIEEMVSEILRILNMSEEDLCKLGSFSKHYSKRFVWEEIAMKDLGFLENFQH
jgi:glycosyltransferase involved in cell wall biosynthesis